MLCSEVCRAEQCAVRGAMGVSQGNVARGQSPRGVPRICLPTVVLLSGAHLLPAPWPPFWVARVAEKRLRWWVFCGRCKVQMGCHAVQQRWHAHKIHVQRSGCRRPAGSALLPASLPCLRTCSCMYVRRMAMPLRTFCSASGPSSSWPRYLQAGRQAGEPGGRRGKGRGR